MFSGSSMKVPVNAALFFSASKNIGKYYISESDGKQMAGPKMYASSFSFISGSIECLG
jgi:hypothetical protein